MYAECTWDIFILTLYTSKYKKPKRQHDKNNMPKTTSLWGNPKGFKFPCTTRLYIYHAYPSQSPKPQSKFPFITRLYVCHAHPCKSQKPWSKFPCTTRFCMFIMPIHPKGLWLNFYGLNKLLYSTSHLFPQDAKCPSTIIECIEIKPSNNHVFILETKAFKGLLERFVCP